MCPLTMLLRYRGNERHETYFDFTFGSDCLYACRESDKVHGSLWNTCLFTYMTHSEMSGSYKRTASPTKRLGCIPSHGREPVLFSLLKLFYPNTDAITKVVQELFVRIQRQSFLRHDLFPAFPARVPVETHSLHEFPLLVWNTKHSGECLQPLDGDQQTDDIRC